MPEDSFDAMPVRGNSIDGLQEPFTLDIRDRQIKRELYLIERYFSDPLPPIDPVTEWKLQTNPGVSDLKTGGTCALAAAGNALRALGLYDPARHTEEKMIEALGGKKFLESGNGGASADEIAKVLRVLAPEVTTSGSISAFEALRAVKEGAVAVVNAGVAHAGVLVPGNRLLKDASGNLEIQVIDSAEGVKNFPISRFIGYQLPITYPPPENRITIIRPKNLTHSAK